MCAIPHLTGCPDMVTSGVSVFRKTYIRAGETAHVVLILHRHLNGASYTSNGFTSRNK